MAKLPTFKHNGQTVIIHEGVDINSTHYECTIALPKLTITLRSFSRKVMRNQIDKLTA